MTFDVSLKADNLIANLVIVVAVVVDTDSL